VFISRLTAGTELTHKIPHGMGGYLYVISGDLSLSGERLETGDAALIMDEPEIALGASADTELILVEPDLG
jgi:redox-sensitive bicupin YhaK (pirin superfamily)